MDTKTNEQKEEILKSACNICLDSFVKYFQEGCCSHWKIINNNLPTDAVKGKNKKRMSKKMANTQQEHLDDIYGFPPFVIDSICFVMANHKQLNHNEIIEKMNKTMGLYRAHLINEETRTLPMDQIGFMLIKRWSDNFINSMNMTPPSLQIYHFIHRYHQSDIYFFIDFDDSIFATSCYDKLEENNMLKWLKKYRVATYFKNFKENEITSIQEIKDGIMDHDDLIDIGISNKSHRQKLLKKISEIDIDENDIVDPDQFNFEYQDLNIKIMINGLSKFFNQIQRTYCSPNICIVTNGSWSWIEYVLNRYSEYKQLFKSFGIAYYSANSMYGAAYNGCNAQWKMECFKYITKRNKSKYVGSNEIDVYSIGDGLDEFIASHEFAKQIKDVNVCRIKLIDSPSEQQIQQQFGDELSMLFAQKRSMKDKIFNFDYSMPSKYEKIDLLDDANWGQSFPPILRSNYHNLIRKTKWKLRNGVKVKYNNKVYEIINNKNWPQILLSGNESIENIMDRKYVDTLKVLVIDQDIAEWMESMSLFCKLCVEEFASLQRLDDHDISKHQEIAYIVDDTQKS